MTTTHDSGNQPTVPSTPSEDAIPAVPGNADFEVRPISEDDKPWIRRVLRQYWASEQIASRGKILNGLELPGFAAWSNNEPAGLITYNITDAPEGRECEIVTHNSLRGLGGIGSILLNAVKQQAKLEGCRRVWLITTNDNCNALRFYQRREFDMCQFHRHAVRDVRRLKGEIPDLGLDNIPLRHEIELEILL
jgi:ribosomal protein S18 acetylase RimI-like enzyme